MTSGIGAVAEKGFNVEAVQAHRALVTPKMVGGYYRHYKGDIYRVINISVAESIGVVMVTYRSEKRDYIWTRTLDDFNAYVNPTRENPDGEPRFARVM